MLITPSSATTAGVPARTPPGAGPDLSATVFSSLGQMTQRLVQTGQNYAAFHAARIASAGEERISVEQLVSQLKRDFPAYTLVSTEPPDVVAGKSLLYIDDSNLEKMAADPSYRARVMGLMQRELAGQSLQFREGGNTVRLQLTGSVFSLSDKNPSVDGIPYSGSATSVSVAVTTIGSGPLTAGLTSSRTAARESLREWLEQALERVREARQTEAARETQSFTRRRLDVVA